MSCLEVYTDSVDFGADPEDMQQPIMTIDLKKQIEEYIAAGLSDTTVNVLKGNNVILIDEDTKLYLDSIDMEYDKETGAVISISADGYLLAKESKSY